MNNEIKEILHKLKMNEDRYNYCLKEDISFSDEDYRAHLLLDYITNLQQKYDKSLELLCDYNMPCEIDEFMNVHSDWCEINCSYDGEVFKKCWDKFIEWKIKDER